MPDSRQTSDDLLLRLLREGRHDAEIAIRLGVSTGELRQRKADLRARLGEERYKRLSGAAGARRAWRIRRRWLVVVGVPVAALSVLLVAANVFAGSEEAASLLAPTTAPNQPTPTLSLPAQVSVDGGAIFEDLGPFISVGTTTGESVGTVSNRATLSVVQLNDTAFISDSAFVRWAVVSSSTTDVFLRGTLAGRQVDVAVYGGRPWTRVRKVDVGRGLVIEIRSTMGQREPPRVLLRANERGQPVELQVTPSGRLLVARTVFAPGTVTDEYSGAKLDVSGAQRFGSIATTPAGATGNACDNEKSPSGVTTGTVMCRVEWQRANRGLTVLFDGVYSCSGARSLRYEAEGIRLEFILSSGGGSATFACQPSSVTAGQTIVPDGEWVIAAFSAEGRPLAIVVADDGTVYVGTIRGDSSCPCLPRPV